MGHYYSDSGWDAQAGAIAIVPEALGTVLDMDQRKSGKSLTPEQNERIRKMVGAYVKEKCGGNHTVAGKHLKMAQSMVSQFLAGEKGVGPKFIGGIADALGYSIDYLYGRTDYPYLVQAGQMSGTSGVHRAQSTKYPNRSFVVSSFASEFHPAVVQRIASMEPTDDRTKRWWVEQLEYQQGLFEAGVFDAAGQTKQESTIPEPKRRR